MTLIKSFLAGPPIDPAAVSTPSDATGKPIYSNPKYFQTKGSIQIDGRTPQAVSQTVTLIQLSKLIQQLSQLSTTSATIFEDLSSESAKLSERLATVKSRVDGLKKLMPLVEKKMAKLFVGHSLGSERQDWKASASYDQQIFNPDTESLMIRRVYDQECLEHPNLAALDQYREDGQQSMKFYSYPRFFEEQWRALMEKEQAQRKKKKKAKRPAVRFSDGF